MRQRIQVKIELGVANKVIANQCNVPLRTVQEYARNMRHYGTVRPPKEPSQGRPRTITPEMEEVLLPSFQNFINFRRCSITLPRALRHTLMSRLTLYGIHLKSR